MLPLEQIIGLVIIAYLLGSVRISDTNRRGQILVDFLKGVAGMVLAAFVVLPALPWQPEAVVSWQQQVLLSGMALALLLGDAVPLPAIFKQVPVRASWWALGGVITSSLVLLWFRPGIMVASLAFVCFVLFKKQNQRWSTLLPLLAIVPVVFMHFGQKNYAMLAAYILFGIFLILEILRAVRPQINRQLIARTPWLFAEHEQHRPLGVSAAVTAIALIITFAAPATLVMAAGLGIVAVSVAKAWFNQTNWLATLAWRETPRGIIFFLIITMVILLPATTLLAGLPFSATALAALIAVVAAIIPLPVDRYALATFAIAAVVYALS